MPTITTRYAVQRKSDRRFWATAGNKWCVDPIGAQWYESIQAAERAALRELPDRREEWTIVPVSDGGR